MDAEKFIRCDLIPQLVADGKLSAERTSLPPRIVSIDIQRLGTDGTFMLTICNKVYVRVYDATAGTESEHKLVVKITPPMDANAYAGVQFDFLFANEIVAYEEILPALRLPGEYPKYYYSHRKPLEAVIVLGDFTANNWQMAKSVTNLPLDYVLAAIKELAKFHGTAFALKLTNSNVFHALMDKLCEARFANDSVHPVWDEIVKLGPKRATNAVRNSHLRNRVPEKFLVQLENLLAEPFKYQKRMVQPVEPFAVLCHGDFMRNNVAFRQCSDEQPEVISSAMMFDYQTLRYASPIIDLVIFLANSTSFELRQQHFNDIFNEYHATLIDAICSKTGEQAPSFLSKEKILYEFVRTLPFGLAVSASFLPVLHEPYEGELSEMLDPNTPKDIYVEMAFNKGGEPVDSELRGQVLEMYEMHEKLNIALASH